MQLQLPRWQLVILTILMVTALGWFGYVRMHQPLPASVNGTYRSSCCEPIILNDGEFITSDIKMPFELRNMKYGLDTRMERYVVVRDGKIALGQREQAGGFLFRPDGHSFTLCAETCSQEFEFKRD